MGTKNKFTDEYINKSADFAKPILMHLRELIHQTCPEVTETKKWSFVCFEYKGMMFNFAAFKKHCAFGFWKAVLMKDPLLIQNAKSESAMGHLGKITSLNDLPSDKKIIAYIKEAMKLNEMGIIFPQKKSKEIMETIVPENFLASLKKNKKAFDNFEAFAPSHKKEFVQWISEAKREETRIKRIEKAIEMIVEGKSKHWKYELP